MEGSRTSLYIQCPSLFAGGFKCGQKEGHKSRDCPNSDSSGGGGGKGCCHCGKDGNLSRDCPNVNACWGRGENSSGDGAERPKGCFKCQQEVHMAKDCTNEPVPRMGLDGKPMEAPYMPPSLPTDEDTLFSAISTGINFDKYDAFPVEVSDPQFRMPFTSFEAMGLGNPPAADLAARQVRQAVPVQKHAVKIALTGRDLMACAPTGSGKTAAFMLPILHSLLSDCCFENPAYQPVQTPMTVILSLRHELAI
ncbi:hypothetical protein HPB51_008048 [Rhipicephalus microplus]|uniref:CCHC-type domain-containing protein n=1 Tax=Rhipicephalus microplus TaxID=6941 RepID=A0A9J6EFC5_RHIMP|nr:hypothetical protein HPB51_008048 [Rhipicephalus microplus]